MMSLPLPFAYFGHIGGPAEIVNQCRSTGTEPGWNLPRRVVTSGYMVYLFFLTLQIGDILTTLLFLRHGVAEANPLMRLALGVSSHPALSLRQNAKGVFVFRLRYRCGECCRLPK